MVLMTLLTTIGGFLFIGVILLFSLLIIVSSPPHLSASSEQLAVYGSTPSYSALLLSRSNPLLTAPYVLKSTRTKNEHFNYPVATDSTKNALGPGLDGRVRAPSAARKSEED